MTPRAEIVAEQALDFIRGELFKPVTEYGRLWQELQIATQARDLKRIGELLPRVQAVSEKVRRLDPEKSEKFDQAKAGFIRALQESGLADVLISSLPLPKEVTKEIEEKTKREGFMGTFNDQTLFFLKAILSRRLDGQPAYPEAKSIARAFLGESSSDPQLVGLTLHRIYQARKYFSKGIRGTVEKMEESQKPADKLSLVIDEILPRVRGEGSREFWQRLKEEFGDWPLERFYKLTDLKGRRVKEKITLSRKEEIVENIPPAGEVVVGSYFQREGVLEKIQDLAGRDLMEIAKEAKISFPEGQTLTEVLNRSLEASAKTRGQPVTNKEEKEVRKILDRVFSGASAKTPPEYLNFRLLLRIIEEIREDEQKLVKLREIIYPDLQLVVDETGAVIGKV